MKPNIQSKIIFSVNGKEETRDVKEYAYTIYDKEGRSIYTNTFYRIECLVNFAICTDKRR